MSFLGGGSSDQSGLSQFDLNALMQALGLNTEAIHNRYAQLGLGIPSGDPIQAAASGQNLHYAGPSTMEQQDIQGANLAANAAAGELETKNMQANPTGSSTTGSNALGTIASLALGGAGGFI